MLCLASKSLELIDVLIVISLLNFAGRRQDGFPRHLVVEDGPHELCLFSVFLLWCSEAFWFLSFEMTNLFLCLDFFVPAKS